MLTEKKINAITLILSGKNKTEIAKILGISRPTLYDWLKDREVIENMNNQREELLQSGNEKLMSRLNIYLDVLHKLATTSTDKRTQATCAIYLTDRILGKVPTTIESHGNNNDENIISTDLELELMSFKKLVKTK